VSQQHHFVQIDTNGFVANLSRTLSQTFRHVEMVCVRDFYNLCPRLSPRGSFGESRQRNGIWAILSSKHIMHLACDEALDRIGQHDGDGEHNSRHVDQVVAVAVILKNVAYTRVSFTRNSINYSSVVGLKVGNKKLQLSDNSCKLRTKKITGARKCDYLRQGGYVFARVCL